MLEVSAMQCTVSSPPHWMDCWHWRPLCLPLSLNRGEWSITNVVRARVLRGYDTEFWKHAVRISICRVRAPQRGEKVSGLAARQRAKLGRILDQVHSDIITERETGTCTMYTRTCTYNMYCYIHKHTLHMIRTIRPEHQ